MLTLAPCPHCASRVPDDGAFCDSCGRPLAACPTCGELARPGEKCLTHGVAAVGRPSAAGGAAPSVAAPVAAPTVAPPPRRGSGGPASPGPRPASSPAAPSPVSPAPANAGKPSNADQGTTVQVLARKLRLIAIGVSLPPLEVDDNTVIGRVDGPFAILLDPFHDKGLSRRHCQIRRGPTGTWSVTDLAGRGSTLVSADGRWTSPPIAQNASQPIEPGRDQLRLGSLTFRIEAIP